MHRSLLILILGICMNTNAQDSIPAKKPNPIVFFEYYGGLAGGNVSGVTYGLTLNYQFFKNDLVTLRVDGYSGYKYKSNMLAPIVGFPEPYKIDQVVNYGVLYGKRWMYNGFSVSVSGGLSYYDRNYYDDMGDYFVFKEENGVGFPFDVSLKWFKKQKRKFRAYYWIIPTGKNRTAFGRSIGLKFVGTISKSSYAGIAISFGLGWHKKY